MESRALGVSDETGGLGSELARLLELRGRGATELGERTRVHDCSLLLWTGLMATKRTGLINLLLLPYRSYCLYPSRRHGGTPA
jgi:hypothetical protein